MNLSASSLAIGFASEADCKAAIADPDASFIEWQGAGLTYIKSPKTLCIIRTGALGGDVREIHGGWKYVSMDTLDIEWGEIMQVSFAFRQGGLKDIVE